MGEYADDFNDAGIDDWRGSGPAQYWGRSRDFPPQYCHAAKRCNRCGMAPLYWEKHDGRWRLHDYVNAEYVLHACAASGTLTEGGDVEQAPSDSLSGPTGNAGDAQ